MVFNRIFVIIIIIFSNPLYSQYNEYNEKCLQRVNLYFCLSNNYYNMIVNNANNNTKKIENKFISKFISDNKNPSNNLTEYMRNLYRVVKHEYSYNIHNKKYTEMSGLKAVGKLRFDDAYLENKKHYIHILPELYSLFRDACNGIRSRTDKKECLIDITKAENNPEKYGLNNHNTSDSNFMLYMYYAELLYIIKSSIYVKYMRDKVYPKAKVFITKQSSAVYSDPIGNIHISEDILNKCNSDCIEIVILHEVLHILSRVESGFFEYTFNDLAREMMGGDYTHERYNHEFMNSPMITIPNKIKSTLDNEAFIDLRVLDFYRKSKYHRDLYIKILNNLSFENQERSSQRIDMLRIANNYINKYNDRDLFLSIHIATEILYPKEVNNKKSDADIDISNFFEYKYSKKPIAFITENKGKNSYFQSYVNKINKLNYFKNKNLLIDITYETNENEVIIK